MEWYGIHGDMRCTSYIHAELNTLSHTVFLRRLSESWSATQQTWMPATRTGRHHCMSLQPIMRCSVLRSSSRCWVAWMFQTAEDALPCTTQHSTATQRYDICSSVWPCFTTKPTVSTLERREATAWWDVEGVIQTHELNRPPLVLQSGYDTAELTCYTAVI